MAIDRQTKLFSMDVGVVTTVAANTTAERDITVAAGVVAVGDFVAVNKPTAQAGLGVVGARVKDAVTVALTYSNTTAGNVQPTDENYLVFVMRP